MDAPRYTRRGFLGLVAGSALGAVVTAGCSAEGGASERPYRSRPDLHAPDIDVTGPAGYTEPGYVFITPSGPLIVDDAGEAVWIHPVPQASANLQVQRYRGAPVLTWWQGAITSFGMGRGEAVIMDDRYREVHRVRAGRGLATDLHEFRLTEQGTAYLTAYRLKEADLTAVGGPRRGTVLDAAVQEVDIATGEVRFEWRALDHIELTESHQVYGGRPFIPVHLNSIDVTSDGNLLVSARNTWTVYKVDRGTGAVLWRLGGKKNDFALGPGVHFAWQHDARSHPGNIMTLFDNEASPPDLPQSRGLVLEVDEVSRQATLVHAYPHPGTRLLASSQGSVQLLANGDVFVGWGQLPYFTEFRGNGTEVLDAKIRSGTSYRALRFTWRGRPTDRPAVAAVRNGPGHLTAYASWNGSTEVMSWEVLAGRSPRTLTVAGAADSTGFETAVDALSSGRYVAVRAVDRFGAELATSPTITV